MKRYSRYRQGVCGILIDQRGQLLLGERALEKGQWQLPQGGIDKGELPLEALHREIQEEVGLNNLKVLRQTSDFISYDWPLEISPKSKYCGQEHIYYVLEVPDIDVHSLIATPEFGRFKWHSPAEAIDRIVEWKKPAYLRAFQELKIF